MMPSFHYVRPTSIDEAVSRLSQPDARLHAGGTDLLGCLRDGVFPAGTVVSLSGLAELRGIEETGGGLRIGALTTIAEVAAHPLIRRRYRGLAMAAGEVASPQLRHQGTLGGNLGQKPRCAYYRGDFHCIRKGGDTCFAFEGENENHCIFGGDQCYMVHPSDCAPALVALAARVRVQGPDGDRTIPVEEFHVRPADDPERETVLEPGEIVTHVVLPQAAPELRSSYRKVRERQAWDFALAGVALAVVTDGDEEANRKARGEPGLLVRQARVVLSGVAPVPWRSPAAEAAITGRRLDAATAARAGEAAVEGAEPLAHNAYKLPLVRGLVEEALRALG